MGRIGNVRRSTFGMLCVAAVACSGQSDDGVQGLDPRGGLDAQIPVALDGSTQGAPGAVVPLADAGPSVLPGRDAASAIDAFIPGTTAADAAPGVAGDGGGAPAVDGPLNTAPPKFSKNVQIDDDGARGVQTEITMAARPDGLVFVGFIDQRSSGRCGFSVSRDGGKTWGKNFFAASQANSARAFAGDPAVAIDDAGNLYAGCQDYASGGLGTNYIMLSVSRDSGATWTEWKRIRQTLDKPWLGASGDGTLYVSWLGSPGGFMRSTDHGATFETSTSLGYLNHGTGISTGEKGLVHVAYNYNNNLVHYRSSTDNGATLSAAREVSKQGTSCFDPCSPRSHPIVGNASDPTGQIVAITWASRLTHPDAEGDDDVWVIVSKDAGKTFGQPIRVNDNTTPSRQFQPWVAVDKHGAVHVVWTDMRHAGQVSTYYARMVDFEAGFEPNVEVSDARAAVRGFLGDYKGIAVQGRDIVVSWTDTRNGTTDAYFSRATDAAAAGGPLSAGATATR
ncbi:MAG: hypothetical protein RL385_3152 [Pseudomonadota bacterium]